MKKKIYATLLGAGLVFSPIAGAQAASLIYLGLGPSNQANVSIENAADLNTEVDANANANANANVNAAANAFSSGIITVDREDAENDTEVNGQGSSNANINAQINANANSNVQGETGNNDQPVNSNDDNRQNTGLPNATSTSASATGQANASAESNLNMNASSVSTEDDLRAFARASIRSDLALNSMSFANDNVSVVYTDQGRFIGIIPVTLNVTVTVDQSGEVEIDYPWYGFLVTKDTAELEARIEAAAEAAASTDAGWTNADRAELAAEIHAALKAHYEAAFSDSETATSTEE